MQKKLSWLLILAIVGAMLSFSIGATITRSSANPPVATVADELVALLPASDAIAIVDVNRIFTEIIPQINTLTADGGAKVSKELDEFTRDTGIDPTKVTTAVIGYKASSDNPSKGNGAAILQGITLDLAKIETAVKANKGTVKPIEYGGKQIYVVSTPQEKSSDAGKAVESATGVKLEEDMAFSQLEANRLAVGSVDGIKAVLDAKKTPANAANAKLTDLLKQTQNGLVRFAFNVPPSATQALTSQGELFQQLAAIKLVFGSLDLSKEFTATLDTKLRTGTNDEAAKLETGLNGLVGLGKMALGMQQGPEMAALVQLLDQIKISAQQTDVSLNISIPRAVFEALAKAGKKEAGPANKQESEPSPNKNQ